MDDARQERLRLGAIAGAAAFVVGLVAAILVAGTPADGDAVFRFELLGSTGQVTWGDLGSQGTSQPTSYQYAGWLYHEAHMATVEGSLRVQSGFGDSASTAVEFVPDPSTVLYLVPLLAVGAAASWLTGQFEAADATAAAKDGAHVAAGYAPPAVLSVLVLAWEAPLGGGTLSVGPDLVTGTLVTGVVYPLVVGGAAGYAAHEYRDDDADGAASREHVGGHAPVSDDAASSTQGAERAAQPASADAAVPDDETGSDGS